MKQHVQWWLLDLFIVTSLAVIFGVLFFSHHAWGAWGDDSPGYVYTAGQLIAGEPLVQQDPLVQRALAYFGDEKLARFVAPSHHEIISPTGWTASRYPIGLAWLMFIVAKLWQWDEAVYLVEPATAVITILLTYAIAITLFHQLPALWRRAIGIIASITLGLIPLYANYAVAQPMREIPSLAFWLLCVWLASLAWQHTQWPRWLRYSALIGVGLSFAMSVNIRETSAILIIPLVCLGFVYGWKWRDRFSRLTLVLGGLAIIIGGALSIWNSVSITQHKEKFREKDITAIAITSNIDHLRTLSVSNWFNNQGKFRPGVGGLKQYWEVIENASPLPLFLVTAVIGLLLLWRMQQRWLAGFFISWAGLIFLLFSAWINPYPRYIIPLLPAFTLVGAFGLVMGLQWLSQTLRLRRFSKTIIVVCVCGAWFAALQPSLADRKLHVTEQTNVYKAINYQDLQTLKQIALTIEQTNQSGKPALLMMTGDWQAGLSETMMTHTPVQVIRYPHKAQEKPPFEKMTAFLLELQQDYDVYLLFDSTANSDEQRLRSKLSLTAVDSFDLSFQTAIELSHLNQ